MQILTAEPLRVEEFWSKLKHKYSYKKAAYCCFRRFDELLEEGNEWLARHPTFQLLNVETAKKKVVHTSEVARDVMQYHGTRSSGVYMYGLRLWLTKVGHDNPQQFGETRRLAFYDILPEKIDGLQYESLTTALEKYNTHSLTEPLPGTLLTIETVCMTMPRRVLKSDGKGVVDSEHCRFTDLYNRHNAFFIRLWYITGAPYPCEIGVTDFIPNALQGIRKETLIPVYAPFDSLYPIVTEWMKNNPELHVRNVQTLDTSYGTRRELGPSRIDTKVGLEIRIEERPRVFYLRASWVRARSDAITIPPSPTGLTAYTFRANITADKSGYSKHLYLTFEGLIRTVGRISAKLETLAEHDPSAAESVISSACRPLWAHVLAYPQFLLEDPMSCSLNQVSASLGDWEEKVAESDTEGRRLSLFYVVRVYMDRCYDVLQQEHFDPVFVREKKECQIM